MSRQRPTKGEGYPYDNSGYDGGQQQYPYYQQPTPPQQFSIGDNRSESYSDDESIEQSHIDKDGWLFRPPENGHVITKGQIANRVIQYYEVSS